MSLDDLQRRLARACLAARPSPDDLAALGAPAARWELYRAMVRSRFVDTLGVALPRTREALGDAGLAEAASSWLDRAPPTTRYVRELSVQFARFLEREPSAVPPGAAPWALDAARYEAAVMECHAALDPSPQSAVELDMALPAALAPAQRLVRTSWGVHLAGAPRGGAWALVVYRAPATDAIETLELTPIAGDIYELMTDPARPLTACVQAALARRDAAAGQVFIESFAGLLGDLMDRGILLGSRLPDRSPTP